MSQYVRAFINGLFFLFFSLQVDLRSERETILCVVQEVSRYVRGLIGMHGLSCLAPHAIKLLLDLFFDVDVIEGLHQVPVRLLLRSEINRLLSRLWYASNISLV